MTGRDREYDRFGPWVIEISDEDPPPPRFMPYLDKPDEAIVSIKIPRPIERRLARPGMDLYDYLVSLYQDDVVVLERDGEDVRTHVFRYRDVCHMRQSEDLLRGRLQLALSGVAFELPYNTVSGDLMRQLASSIRERYAAPEPVLPPEADVDLAPETLSFYFERRLGAERADDPGVRALAAQPEIAIREVESNALRRAWYGAVSKRLLETLWLCDGRELRVIGRGATYAYRWQNTYGVSVDYLPVANLRDARWRPEAGGARQRLELTTDGGTRTWVFTEDDAALETLRAYLARVAGPAGPSPRLGRLS